MDIKLSNVPLHRLANVSVTIDEATVNELGITERTVSDLETLVRLINQIPSTMEVSDPEFFSIDPDRVEPDPISIEIIN